MSRSPTHSRTHSLAHSLSLAHSRTRSLAHTGWRSKCARFGAVALAQKRIERAEWMADPAIPTEGGVGTRGAPTVTPVHSCTTSLLRFLRRAAGAVGRRRAQHPAAHCWSLAPRHVAQQRCAARLTMSKAAATSAHASTAPREALAVRAPLGASPAPAAQSAKRHVKTHTV